MKRREFIRTLGLGTAALAGSGALSPFLKCSGNNLTGGKPNFIIINVDDLGWTDLSSFGSEYYETPNIDRLAAQGMKFTNAYAACAVCSPTRAAIMTGRYPARIGVTDWIHHLDAEAITAVSTRKNPVEYVGGKRRKLLCPPNNYFMELDEVTIAEVLKDAGYTSCHVGKWHLGHFFWFPDKQGFDYNYGGTEIGQPPTYFDPYFLNKNRPSISTLPPRLEGEYLTDRESDEACGFIRKNADKAFFLNMCHYAVHTPLQGKEELVEKYETKEKTNHKNPKYAAMIESVDQAVGRLLDTLDELDLTERTVVIFTSDNGGLLGHSTDNSPLRSGKGYPYEGGIRVPLIVRWPGVVQAGSVSHIPVTSVDYFPTICETSGAGLPRNHVIDGESIIPVLRNEGTMKREALYWHFPHYRGSDVVPYSIIRKGDWKLIKRYEGKEFELFNLNDDLSEENDLSDDMPEKVNELNAELEKWITDTGAKMPGENPDFEPGN
ncbi:sulfatase [candidate division KSB1 bacterium]